LAVAEAIRETERDRQLHERLHEYTETISGSLNARAMKKCAMCAEMIPEEAKKCALCHEMQEQP
jgi:hypothetical protein